MPKYTVTDPSSGRKVTLTGDSPPTETELEDIFSKVNASPAPEQAQAAAPQAQETKSALFPRTAKGAEADQSYPRQVMAAGADLLSLPGRGIAAAFDGDRGYKESLADTQGGNIASKVVRDPGTGAAILTAPITGPAVAGIKGAGMLANAARVGITGAIEGAASAGAHQAENLGAGKKVSAPDAALETAVSAALPVGLGVVGKFTGGALQATGKKILDSAIKPAKKFTRGQGSKFEVQNAFDQGLDSWKGIRAMDEKIGAFHAELNDKYAKELAAVEGGVFNAGAALKEAVKKAEKRLEKGGLGLEEEAGIKHGAYLWDKYLGSSEFIKNVASKGEYSLPAGSMPADAAVAVRKAVQAAAHYDRTDPKAVKGAELFAQDFQSAMNEQLSKKFPQLRKLDAEFAKLHPVENATKDAVARMGKNYGISLLDLGGLGVLGLGAGSQDKNTSLSGLALLAATRGARSPGAASVLYRGGKKLAEGNGVTRSIRELIGRGAAQNFRNEDQ